MPTEPSIYELLYVSVSTQSLTGQPTGVVPQIARQARKKNSRLGITGLLIFDGERFCQHLEGEADRVLSLFDCIKIDSRHSGCQVLYQGNISQRKFARFSMGYATVGDVDPLQTLEASRGMQARRIFEEILKSVDMEP